MINRRTLIVLIVLFFTVHAKAISLHPEFTSLNEQEAKSFDDPSLVDGEYESDFLTYAPSLSQVSLYYSSPRAFIGSVGSLGAKQFFINEAFHAKFSLYTQVDFSITHFHKADFEDEFSGTILEFIFWDVNHKNAFSVFGEPEFQKRSDDLGISYIRQIDLQKYLSVYIFYPEMSRNDRNIDTDRFRKRPVTLGTLFREVDNIKKFREISLRYEEPTEWEFSDIKRLYKYDRLQFILTSRSAVESGYRNLQFEFERKHEKEEPTAPASTIIDTALMRERYRAQWSRELQKIEAGLMWSKHIWRRNDESQSLESWQPFFWTNIIVRDKNIYRFGYSFVSVDHDGKISTVKKVASKVDHRFNLAWQYVPSVSTVLEVLLTFDGDRLARSDFWEGGNVKLSSTF
ncbi:MAG: hypothetical protein A2Z20_08675 [Bdellovibrionales bacterium RBG_16_40_8]|nr:MAG: hypothetical protein A2Z20_08675 [Bdellovibrionales bacterium RBG_16_40_8]